VSNTKAEVIFVSKTIALVIAEKMFRDEEYSVPKSLLEVAGHKVLTVSTTLNMATGKLGMEAQPEVLLHDLGRYDLDALIFIGGSGASQYFDNPYAHRLAWQFASAGKIVGAICIGPVILAKAGLLKGKQATVFSDGAPQLRDGGAYYTGNPLEIDGKLITANGPEAAEIFGQALVQMLNANM
jgi:protease I